MNTALTVFIIVTIVFLICIGIAYAFIIRIKRKASEIALEAFGTSDIAKGFKQMQEDFEETPKSVAAMTSVMLPRITRDFPDFNYDEMRIKAENVLTSYLRAISERTPSIVQDAGPYLKQKLEVYINMLEDRGLCEHFDLIKLHRTEISSYRKAGGKCIITFQSSAESMHYTTDREGNVREGDKERKEQGRFNVELIYVQDIALTDNEMEGALGITCPKCGAPVKVLGTKYCEYCGAGIVEQNTHVWTFSNVEAVK